MDQINYNVLPDKGKTAESKAINDVTLDVFSAFYLFSKVGLRSYPAAAALPALTGEAGAEFEVIVQTPPVAVAQSTVPLIHPTAAGLFFLLKYSGTD